MKYSRINLVILIIILIFIIVISVCILDYYHRIKRFYEGVVNSSQSIITSFEKGHDTIYYPKTISHINIQSVDSDVSHEDEIKKKKKSSTKNIITREYISSSRTISSTTEILSMCNMVNKEYYCDPLLAELLINVNMSCYNLYFNLDPQFPKYISYANSIGENGYLLKLKKRNFNSNIYILAYRGTTSNNDLLTDLDSVQTPYTYIKRNSKYYSEVPDLLVHRGFHTYWKKSGSDLKELYSILNSDDILIITGHSLGCSSAAMSALSISQYHSNIYMYLFAPPRIGNDTFMETIYSKIPKQISIINKTDLIPNLPPIILPTFGHNWIYDNWPNIKYIDIQLGSILPNHKLNTYMCGLDENSYTCDTKQYNILWNRQ
uniref:Class 3 lipase n=1 Tax=Pithovirus LCPAC101 TaxID=2506586 RepID=A0A481Z2S2_9VIRU|nr:MAG: class 3 lipase [Pithovirus LCPAC101]